MSFFKKLLDWPTSLEPEKRVVHLEDFGFEIEHRGARTAQVNWDSVVEITAFKRDLFSIDEVCLGFRCTGEDRFRWLGEDDIGFDILRKEMERRFPAIPRDWFNKVILPPFEESWTTIWGNEFTP